MARAALLSVASPSQATRIDGAMMITAAGNYVFFSIFAVCCDRQGVVIIFLYFSFSMQCQ
jgi:hypothetical protein